LRASGFSRYGIRTQLSQSLSQSLSLPGCGPPGSGGACAHHGRGVQHAAATFIDAAEFVDRYCERERERERERECVCV
jgi:hypothetical protein